MCNKLIEKEIERNEAFNGKIFKVVKCKATLPDGRVADREIILHNGGAGILPIDDEKYVYLVKQYRYGVHNVTLEIPAGKLEVGEDPKDCAVRELSEEVGFTASDVISLGSIYPSPAILSEVIYIYIAKGLSKGDINPDDDEYIDVVKLTLEEAIKLVESGEIIDAKTQIALLKAGLFFGNER